MTHREKQLIGSLDEFKNQKQAVKVIKKSSNDVAKQIQNIIF